MKQAAPVPAALSRADADLIARLVVSGRRCGRSSLDRFADGLARAMRSRLTAIGAPGASRATGKGAVPQDRDTFVLIERRVEKHLGAFALRQEARWRR